VSTGPIGIFDSGFGGLTVLREIEKKIPQYDYLYLGDNARAPYGPRSFETVYQYTLECVKVLFSRGCNLVILACNTASAKALRNIQQNDLPLIAPGKRVLGVIRPTTEVIGELSKSRHVGVLATQGTVASDSYRIEISKFFPDVQVTQKACPLWVPLIESGEHQSPGGDYFIQKNSESLLENDSEIDTIILGCTHYPLIENQIRKYVPPHIRIVSQAPIVAESLKDYLYRHPEMERTCSKGNSVNFLTTDTTSAFDKGAALFYGKFVTSSHVVL
jgi:glutamate racemase